MARYLGAPPWELAEQPGYWFWLGREKMLAEAEAAAELSKSRAR